MQSSAQPAAKTLEEMLRAIVIDWMQQFPGLMAYLNSEQRYYSHYEPDARVKIFANLIIEQYRDEEREKLVSDLLRDRDAKDSETVVSLLTGREANNTISTQDLGMIVGICDGHKAWTLARLVYRVRELLAEKKIGEIYWSGTRAKFLKLFVYPNIVSSGHKRYFDDEKLRRFFKLMRMRDSQLEKLCRLSETMYETYFNFFFYELLQAYTTPFIRDLCTDSSEFGNDSEEEAFDAERMLQALSYLVLLKGQYEIDHPATQHFVNVLEKNELAKKKFTVSEYCTVDSTPHLFDHHFHGLNWTVELVDAMMKITRNDKDLFTAIVELVVATNGESLDVIKRIFPSKENPDLTLLTTMVFDYPAYLSSLRFYRLDRAFFEDHFVRFTGYQDQAAVRNVLRFENLGEVHLLNPGRDPARAFNLLQAAGVYEELLAVDHASRNIQILALPPGEDGFCSMYFEAKTMIHAHQTEWVSGQTLLQALLTTDETRLKLLVRTMNLFCENYLERGAEDQSQNTIQMSQDFIRTGMMEGILSLNPPELIAAVGKFGLDIDRCVEVLFREMKEGLDQYSRTLQIAGLNMMLRVFNQSSNFLINMEQSERALDQLIAFLVDQFRSFVETVGANSVAGQFKQTTEDKALAYILSNLDKSQSQFEKQIKNVLDQFGVHEVKRYGTLL